MDAVKFQLGQRVWAALDAAKVGLVTGIIFRPGCVLYEVEWADMVNRDHYDFELSPDKCYTEGTPP